MKFNEFIEVVWGAIIILLAIKYFAVLGVFAALSFVLAGIKIGTLPLDRRFND